MNKKMAQFQPLLPLVHLVKTLYCLGYAIVDQLQWISNIIIINIYLKLQIRLLEKDGNPNLKNIPILFTSKSPLGHVEPLVELEETKKEIEPLENKGTIE